MTIILQMKFSKLWMPCAEHGLLLVYIYIYEIYCFPQKWRDQYLRWDPHEFGGVQRVRVIIDRIWKPDVMLINT